MKPTVISTFAGCGGSSLGYELAGYKELLAIDFDKNAAEVYIHPENRYFSIEEVKCLIK